MATKKASKSSTTCQNRSKLLEYSGQFRLMSCQILDLNRTRFRAILPTESNHLWFIEPWAGSRFGWSPPPHGATSDPLFLTAYSAARLKAQWFCIIKIGYISGMTEHYFYTWPTESLLYNQAKEIETFFRLFTEKNCFISVIHTISTADRLKKSRLPLLAYNRAGLTTKGHIGGMHFIASRCCRQPCGVPSSKA